MLLLLMIWINCMVFYQ